MLSGSFVALITPFNKDGSVDFAAFRTLLKFQEDNGSAAILIMGSTGESSMLSPEEKKAIIVETAKMKTPGMPIFFGCTGNNTETTIANVRFAKDNGADGAILAAPAYICAPEADIERFFLDVADATDLPLGIYNNPPRVKSDLHWDHLLRIFKHPNYVVHKELTARVGQVAQVLAGKPSVSVMCCDSPNLGLVVPDDPPVWAAHVLIGGSGAIQFETDRARFLGRGNTPALADALRRDLAGSTGAVLDPVFSLRCRATLEPRDRVELSFLTLAADSRDALMALVAKHERPESVARAFEIAWTRSQLEFRYLGIGPASAHRFQELASHLLYPNPRLRATSDRLTRNRLGQTGLWAFGLSGDLPILTVTIAEVRSLPLVRELLLAHTYWRMRGLHADLVILNQETPSYESPLRQQLQQQVEAHSTETGVDKPGGVFLRDWHSIPEDGRNLILATSSVVLSREPRFAATATRGGERES